MNRSTYGYMNVDRWCALGMGQSEIYCNGVLAKHVVAFHDGEGWMDCLSVGPHGYLAVDPSTDTMPTVRHYGAIEVVRRP